MRKKWLSNVGALWVLTSCAAYGQVSPGSQAPSMSQTGPGSSAEKGLPTTPGNNTGVEEIVVTAQRRSEKLQSVPIAITAITAERLEDAGITSAADLGLVTPGLTIQEGAGYIQPHIRGVGTSATGPSSENPVALYIDGVYFASGAASLLTLNNIDRIEVLKGPQGTLFGRNSTGGLIQVITKDPTQALSGSVNFGYASYDTVHADAYVTGGLTDSLAADLAVEIEHQGEGWGHNLYNGEDVNILEHDLAARSKLVYDVDENTAIKLAIDYEDRIGSLDAQHAYPGYPLTFNTAAFGGPFLQGGPFDVNKNTAESSRLRSGGISIQLNRDFDAFALQSLTAYRKASFGYDLDLDETPVNIIDCCGDSTQEQVSQEFQLSSNVDGPLKWVAGIFLYYDRDTWEPLDIVLNGPLSPFAGMPFDIRDNNAQRTLSAASYLQASYDLEEGTRLTLGGRLTYEGKHVSGTETYFSNGAFLGSGPFPLAGLGIPNSIQFRRFNYRISVDHKFGQNILGYLSYNTGFKSGGYNLSQSANPPYQPELLKAAEVGLKIEAFNRRLRFNSAVFHYDYTNLQVARFIGGTEEFTNGAKAEMYGFDFDANLVVASGLSLSGGLGYVHDRFASFPGADFFPGVGGCSLPLGSFCSMSAAGHRLPGTPSLTYNVGANYDVQVAYGALAFNVTYAYSTKWYAAADNYAFQPGYGILNASIRWTDPSGHYSIRAWGKNLNDAIYSTGIFEANQGVIRSVGAPRTFGVTLGYEF